MPDQGITTLQLPARRAVLLAYLGQIGLALAVLASVPTLVAALTGNIAALWRYALVITALLAISLPLSRRACPPDLQANEGLVITATVFLASPFLMAFPMTSAGIGYGQALFEAVSAVTTTGLSTLASVEDKPASFLFARAWMQWYGGLGIVALLPLWIEPGPAARRFLGLDTPESGNTLTSARFYSRRILIVYVLLTGGGVLLLWVLGTPAFPALLHVLAAVSTGGFSSYDASLAGLSGPAAAGTIFVSVLGALPFVIYLRALRGDAGRLFSDLQVRTLLAMGLAGTLGLGFLLHQDLHLAWPAALADAGLLAFSAQSTAGFTLLDLAALGAGAKLLLILLMAAGGGLGSTAGGIKLLRLLILFRLIQLLLQRASLPRDAWLAPQLGGMNLDEQISLRALLLILLFLLTIVFSWLPFVLAGVEPLDALFEVVSAVGTVGLSVGVTHAGLNPLLQGILCADMWLGRLEIVAVLVLLSPAVWRTRRETL